MGEFGAGRERDQGLASNNARRDRMFYIADMLTEMKTMAEQDRCETLSSLLALAASEALRKASE